MRLVQCGQTLREYHRTSVVMLPFRLIYSDDYYLPIGAHVFPAEKYRLVHRRLLDTKIAEPADFLIPQPASDQDILLVHKPEYVNKLKNGTAAIFAGTRTASEPLPSVSASALKSSGAKMRGAHAGDVFTISLHQHNNYPAWKPHSSIDVDLPDGIGDDDYLAWLDNALSSGLRQFEPDLICYIAGADPYREDQLGGLELTIAGLKKRDELVFNVAAVRGIPVMVTFAGGYAQRVEDTVTIHCNTVVAATEVFGDPA